jgi:hypothetical protein
LKTGGILKDGKAERQTDKKDGNLAGAEKPEGVYGKAGYGHAPSRIRTGRESRRPSENSRVKTVE